MHNAKCTMGFASRFRGQRALRLARFAPRRGLLLDAVVNLLGLALNSLLAVECAEPADWRGNILVDVHCCQPCQSRVDAGI